MWSNWNLVHLLVGREVKKWGSHYESGMHESSQNQKIELPHDLAIPLLGIYPKPKKQRQNILLYTCPLKQYSWQNIEAIRVSMDRGMDIRRSLHIQWG